MKIKTVYLAGAIRGDPSYSFYYDKIIKITSKFAFTRTEKSEKPLTLHDYDEKTKNKYKKHIYERDIKWLNESNAVIAECSGASTGVGYEIAYTAHVLKRPILCLINNKAMPSLMIDQNTNEYIIPIRYNDEKDIEYYIEIFVKLLETHNNYSTFKRVYIKIQNELRELYDSIEKVDISEYIENKLIEQQKFDELDQSSIISFTDSKVLYDFLFKSNILQYRWSKLKTQRIGKYYISGRKKNIISVLSNIKSGNISDLYINIDKKKLNYNEFAFKKNIRAYRLIGLLIPSEKLKFGGTKLKNNLTVYQTLDNKIYLNSTTKKHYLMPDYFEVTKYITHLNMFQNTFSLEKLVQVLIKASQQKWFNELHDVSMLNIDDISINNIKNQNVIKEINSFLLGECENLITSHYSSFYLKQKVIVSE